MEAKDRYHHGSLRKTLMDAALDSLEKDGLQGLSLRKLAESAGVSKTAPYRHFKDKKELLINIAADGFGMLADRLAVAGPADAAPGAEATAEAGHPAVDAGADVMRLFRAYIDFARERPALYKLMFSPLGYSLHSEKCRLNSERALGYLFSAVGKAQAAGWRSGRETRALGLSIWASVHGWATLLIDNLLPEWIAGNGDEWIAHAQALLI